MTRMEERQLDSSRRLSPVRRRLPIRFGECAVVGVALCFCSAKLPAQMTDLLTYHNDNARTGQALHEEVLTPGNVTASHFGLLWTLPTDGKVDAQPLYAAGVQIPGRGERNVLFVATEHDTLYAFDADSTNILWKVSLLGTNETPSDSRNCDLLVPEIGITATPVIDRQLGSNGTIFVVAMSKTGSTYFHRIHSLDLATGLDRVTSVVVAATYPGTGANSSNGNVIFDPKQYMERSGLLLLNGTIYTGWASHCDADPYTGWIIGYDEHTLAQNSVLNLTPNGMEGGIWMAGAGLAADSSNNIYFLEGNGTFETALTAVGFPSLGDFGNSFIKLSTITNTLAVADYFTMSNNIEESFLDLDLGSGGALLLPDMVDTNGTTRQLAVGAGKDMVIYLVDRNNLGKFNSTTNLNYQSVNGALSGRVFSMPAYFNGTLYYGAVGDYLKAFPFQNARLGAASSHSPSTFVYPGATPGISANGTSNGIVWATVNSTPVQLLAFDPTNLGSILYSSAQNPGRDSFGVGNKFITPTIASARVYVGATNQVGVFGLLDDSTLTPLQQWRNTYFHNPSDVGAGADTAAPRGDSVPNLMKYALGLNPTTSVSTAQLPVLTIQSDVGQDYLTLSVHRAAEPSDVTYNVQVSGDLQNWESSPPFTVTLTNIPSQLDVRDNVPVSGATDRFIRLQVTNP